MYTLCNAQYATVCIIFHKDIIFQNFKIIVANKLLQGITNCKKINNYIDLQ